MKFFLCLLFCLLVSLCSADSIETGCWFLRDAKIEVPSSLKPVRIQDFLIHAPSPDAVLQNQKIFERSTHFLQTELGWKIPYTRKELSRSVLEVYFISAPANFTGSVRSGPVVLLNEKVLGSPDFAAHWIHYLAHASELMYRDVPATGRQNRKSRGQLGELQDFWFYEATAGWMEGQFGNPSAATRLAKATRRFRPHIPLDDGAPDLALGTSFLLDLVSLPHRDVIRQSWEQWSYSREERVMDILGRVLQLNHLPSRESYLLNYFLRVPVGNLLLDNTTDIVIRPYSAAVIQGKPDTGTSGGIHLMFQPKGSSSYSASLIYYGEEEKEGILTIKESLRNGWSVTLPYAGMARYRMIVVNGSGQIVRGTIIKKFDPAIPAVLEYFRANADEEGGVQLEWKTAREEGVAFWNLYRMNNGTKERLNALPIPASIDSATGLHYMFVDYINGAFYYLEAITGEGFPSSVATTTTGSSSGELPDDQ